MLKIWGRKTSSNVQKVLWMATELGLEFEQIDVGGAFGRLNEAFYVQMNPNRKIPTLDDDGFILWESNAIVRYLGNRYAKGAAIYPTDPKQLASADRWMDWHTSTVLPFERPIFLGMIRTPPEQRDMAAIRENTRSWAEHYAILDAHLASHRFIAGAEFTIGDIPLGISVHRWFSLDLFERPQFPHLAAWYALLSERPGYREYVKVKLV